MNKHNSGDLLTTKQHADTYVKLRHAISLAENHGSTIMEALDHMDEDVEAVSNGLTRLENMRIIEVLNLLDGCGSEYSLRIKGADLNRLPSTHFTSEDTYSYDDESFVEVKTYLVYTLEGAAEIQRNIDALPSRIEEWREMLDGEIISTFDEVQELHKAMFGTTAELNSFFGLGL